MSAISRRSADDLEEWEKREASPGDSFDFEVVDSDGETCVIEFRLSEKDRRAIAALIEALEAAKGGSK